MRIGSRTQAFAWYHSEWPSVTSNPYLRYNTVYFITCSKKQTGSQLSLPHKFQGHAIIWRWLSQKRYEIQTQLQSNTNSDYTRSTRVSFQMTLSDLAKYSATRSIARSLCDSWASCLVYPFCRNFATVTVVITEIFVVLNVYLVISVLQTAV